MSLLTPLYILGVLAIAGPIVFHLIRRLPKGEVPFSSLMFLSPTPPRLTRRSRLDNWLLLLLRAAALCLLAAAFARPFLREAAILNFGDEERRRIALLIDVSASMRRGDLWSRARQAAEKVIAEIRPGDELAVFAFDESTHPLLSFSESKTLDPARRRAVARGALSTLSPTWESTRLGQALIDAVGAIEDGGDSGKNPARMPRRIVLVSDLQQGSRIDALGDFEWPSDIDLDLRTVVDNAPNASIQWLSGPVEGESADPGKDLRVRVSNEPGSKKETFEVGWFDARNAPVGKAVSAYVPPGESRVVRIPRPAEGSMPTLRLKGDAEPFDNSLFLATEPKSDATVVFLGLDIPDDPAGLLYYLQRVFEDTPSRAVRVEARPPSAALAIDPGRPPALVVVATETTTENINKLQKYVREGGSLLCVVANSGLGATLGAIAGGAGAIEAANVDGDVMLSEIAFDHPFFSALSGAQFNDFTKIHFWKHRRIDPSKLGDAKVLARFEGGDAAVIEKAVGKGRIVVLASGWNPVDGQLARSSKFVPMMASLLESREPRPVESAQYKVGESVPIAPGSRRVAKPGNSIAAIPAGASTFADTDRPGIYEVESAGSRRAFAVNLDPIESKTAALQVETLEQFGCKLAASKSRESIDREQLRQMQNLELEGRQKLWRWLVLTAIGVLIVETWLAGRRSRPARAEAAAI